MKYYFLIIGIILIALLIQTSWMLLKTKKKANKTYRVKAFDQDKYDVVYQDMDWIFELFWREGDTLLKGKPDYILEDKKTGDLIVMDLKSGKAPYSIEPGYHHQTLLRAFSLQAKTENR